jgi:DNA-directed RNA polymerase specialized sigma24 family protein
MRSQLYSRLCAIARRDCGEDAEDVVQEALLVAVRNGRSDLGDAATARWLAGVVRNRARMIAEGLDRLTVEQHHRRSTKAPHHRPRT